MHFVTDFHLHSKYSRAVSPDMTMSTMARMAAIKGLDILSIPDWTHPLWMKEVLLQIDEGGNGLYKLKSQANNDSQKETLFIFATEISSIYKDKNKLRRIHNLIFAPNVNVVEKITNALLKRGANLHADGRPIIGLSSKNLLELILSIDEQAFLIPCHVWTPHFGMYGSASGYDSIEESFEGLSKVIYGIETGLSSDPEMNWQMTELANRSILSFSDAHSPLKMAREATVMDLAQPTFGNIKKAIMRNSADNKIIYTLEFYPEEGKYHYSGHRNCNVIRGPKEIAELGPTCPVCHKRLTEGVMYRIQTLAGEYADTAEAKENSNGLRWYTDPKKKHPPYVKLVPLLEIVAESMGSTVASQKVKNLYFKVCQELGSELSVLLKAPIEDIGKVDGNLAEGVEKVRRGTIHMQPGYDNVYGVVKIWDEKKNKMSEPIDESQLSLI
jgi:uncharacterized protein (TIGR00375 family)